VCRLTLRLRAAARQDSVTGRTAGIDPEPTLPIGPVRALSAANRRSAQRAGSATLVPAEAEERYYAMLNEPAMAA
jgi:hypothetical protein